MNSFYQALLDLVFPPRCAGCQRHGVAFCSACVERCVALRRDVQAAPDDERREDLVTSMEGVYRYDAPLRAAIMALKYRRQRHLAAPLGALLTADLSSFPSECEAVIAVPLHPTRQRERGFNQSALLAQAVAAAMGTRVVAGLERVRPTAQQVGLDHAAREANVRDAFAWRGKADVPGSVLLIDDVLTTGSTLRACARALRNAGAREVHARTLATGGH